MESYHAFLERIFSFEKPDIDLATAASETPVFKVNSSVAQKVANDNTFKGFYGDTVVFDLEDTTKARLANYVTQLYSNASECFCERLHNSTFHMTLHDLSNGPVLQNISGEMEVNERHLRQIFETMSPQTIRMKSTYLFNMVNTSLVLGLCPVDEKEYHKLMELYYIIDAVKTLPYPLTPHITLAYYNLNGFDANAAEKLAKIVRTINIAEYDPFEIVLDTNCLCYQHFTSMNDYKDIFRL